MRRSGQGGGETERDMAWMFVLKGSSILTLYFTADEKKKRRKERKGNGVAYACEETAFVRRSYFIHQQSWRKWVFERLS